MDLDLAFKILELEKSVDMSEVRIAYRDLAQVWHPDKFIDKPRLAAKAAAKMKDINSAYTVVKEYSRNNESSFKEKPEKKESFNFIVCVNCGTTNRISKNKSNNNLRCGKCRKNPNKKAPQYKKGKKWGMTCAILCTLAVLLVLPLLTGIAIDYQQHQIKQLGLESQPVNPTTPSPPIPVQFPLYPQDNKAPARGFEPIIGNQPDALGLTQQVMALNNQGDAYYDTKQYTKAIEAFQQAIRIKPDHALSWKNLGAVYIVTEQYAKAIEACQQAIRIKPDYADPWYNLGVIYKILGQTSKVMEVYKRLNTLDQILANEFSNKVVNL